MAQISNLHFGLRAWAAGSFTSGQRCSNAGNAYQCVTSGSSTIAPTGTDSSISGGGGTVFSFLSTIDFATPQAWADSLPSTLTEPVRLLVWNDGPITTTTGVPFLVLSGHTTTSANSITIIAAPQDTLQPGILAFNSSAAPSFVLPSGNGGINYFVVQDNFVTFRGLQFKDPNANSGSTIFSVGGSCTWFGCIIDGYSQPGGANMIEATLAGPPGSVYRFTNCLVVDRAASATTATTIRSTYSGRLINNTFVAINNPINLSCVFDHSAQVGTTVTLTNNIMLGYSYPSIALESDCASTVISVQYGLNSASSFTDPRVSMGAGNIFSAPMSGQFVNLGTNFNLLPLSQANNTALTDTTDLPSATDIFGQSRPSGMWDMGCVQLNVPSSVGTASGQASVLGVSGAVFAPTVGTAGGQASVLGVSLKASVGTARGQASVQGISNQNMSSGIAQGQASVQGYSAGGAIEGIITLQNPGVQVVNTPFTVDGTLTLTPDLQIADDASTTFTPIPESNVSPLGSTQFEIDHPGVPTLGQQNLLVEDLSTDASAAVNYTVSATPPPPPLTQPAPEVGASLTSLASIIPAYVYQEYSDDPNVAAFFQAYNVMAQSYLDYMNNLNLPIYQNLSGSLLDWVALGLYGMKRPVLTAFIPGTLIGPFNTYQLDEIAINDLINTGSASSVAINDDIFKRIITFNFYKGDGTTFTATWLKRRVMRFLAGKNGTDYFGPTTQVSVQYVGFNTINISLLTGAVELTMAPTFQAAVLSQVVELPFQYSFNVLIP